MIKFEIYNTIKNPVLNNWINNYADINITEKSVLQLKEHVLQLKEEFFNIKIVIFDNNLSIINLSNNDFCIIQWNKIDNYFNPINKLNSIPNSYLSKTNKEKLSKILNYYSYIEINEKSIKLLLIDISFMELLKCEIKHIDGIIYINYNNITFYELIIIEYNLKLGINLLDDELLITNFVVNIDLFKLKFNKLISNNTNNIFLTTTIYDTIINLIEKYNIDRKETKLLSCAINLLIDNFELFHVLFDYTDEQKELIFKHGLVALTLNC